MLPGQWRRPQSGPLSGENRSHPASTTLWTDTAGEEIKLKSKSCHSWPSLHFISRLESRRPAAPFISGESSICVAGWKQSSQDFTQRCWKEKWFIHFRNTENNNSFHFLDKRQKLCSCMDFQHWITFLRVIWPGYWFEDHFLLVNPTLVKGQLKQGASLSRLFYSWRNGRLCSESRFSAARTKNNNETCSNGNLSIEITFPSLCIISEQW